MAQITAFKCDQCGKIVEDGRPILYVDADSTREFIVKEFSRYATIDKGVCSYDCVKDALEDWITERQIEADKEAAATADIAEIKLEGVQPS